MRLHPKTFEIITQIFTIFKFIHFYELNKNVEETGYYVRYHCPVIVQSWDIPVAVPRRERHIKQAQAEQIIAFITGHKQKRCDLLID